MAALDGPWVPMGAQLLPLRTEVISRQTVTETAQLRQEVEAGAGRPVWCAGCGDH